MPKTLADEHIALRLLSEAPEDIDAITAEEFNAGTPLECRIMDYRLSPTASDLVTSDLRDWIIALKDGLGPSACGQVVDCGGEDCRIIVQWDDARGTGGSTTQQLSTETRL